MTHNCPYCGADLDLCDDNGMIRCSSCRFEINEFKYNSIRDVHRRRTVITKMHWQNLKKDRCPMCGDDLSQMPGNFEILRCISSHCSFHIRMDRMEAILADETHPANTYKEKHVISRKQ